MNATVVDPSTKTVHREAPAMESNYPLNESPKRSEKSDSFVGLRQMQYAMRMQICAAVLDVRQPGA